MNHNHTLFYVLTYCLLIIGIKYVHPDYNDDDVCVRYYKFQRIVYGVSSLFKHLESHFVFVDDEIILSHGTIPPAFDVISLCYRFWRWRILYISVVYIYRLTARYYCRFVIIYGLPNSFSFCTVLISINFV
jgi:hypothetical protein